MKKTITIQGMHCASCAINIEEDLRRTKGVTKANVNYATAKATVEYDAGEIELKKIAQVVQAAGYQAIYDEIEDHAFRPMYTGAKMSDSGMWLKRFIGSLIFGLPAIYFMLAMWLPALSHEFLINHSLIIQAISAGLVIIFSINLWISGAKSLVRFRPNMDSLVFIGTAAAFFYSLYLAWPELSTQTDMPPEVYFESAVFILIFISLGKYLEALTKGRTSQAVQRLIGLQPKEATIIFDNQEKTIPISQVKVGDIVLIKPGDQVPVDGVIISGQTTIDEKAITGESIPVDKQVGDEVVAGTINQESVVRFRATKVGQDTMLAKIIQIVEDALGSKAPIQQLADKISLYFVPAVMLMAVISLMLWLYFDQPFSQAIQAFVAVLIIACPCALGLATPTAVMMGTGLAADRGILIKTSDALEKAKYIDTVVFDKTGTITQGKPEVIDIIALGKNNPEKVLTLAASLDQNSRHPLALAIGQKAVNLKLKLLPVTDFLSKPGMGVVGKIKQHNIRLGNRRLFKNSAIYLKAVEDQLSNLERQGKTAIIVSSDQDIIGIIALADTVKKESEEAIMQLRQMGKNLIMLTGDNQAVGQEIARQVGIEQVIADVLPQDKATAVRNLQDEGRVVAMIGDGINDAPALAQADLGIAMGAGTDVAIETGEIILIRDNLLDVVQAIKISTFTINKIRQNLFWAFFYNIIGIPIAAGILFPFTGWLLNPAIAAAAMAFSSVSVVLNSLSMSWYKQNDKSIF